MSNETIELIGHIIDSWTLPRVWDIIMDRGGNFAVEEMRIGTHKTDPSYARMKVEAPNDEVLELILSELMQFGAVLVQGNDAQTTRVEQQGVLPAKFYSTTNLPTQVRLHGQWVNVEQIDLQLEPIRQQGPLLVSVVERALCPGEGLQQGFTKLQADCLPDHFLGDQTRHHQNLAQEDLRLLLGLVSLDELILGDVPHVDEELA